MKRLLLALLAVTVTASPQSPPEPAAAPPAPAEPAAPVRDDDAALRRVQQRKTQIERELARLRGQERSLLGEVERLELEVRLRTEELREAMAVLQKANARLEATSREVRVLEKDIAEARPVLAARARALYKMGDLSYLRILLSVDRPSDIFRGYRLVTTVARRDNQRIARFRGDLQALGGTREKLEQETQDALALKDRLDVARRTLDQDRRRKTAALTSLVEKKENQAAFLEELQQAEGKLQDLIAGLGSGDVAVPLPVFRGSLPWPAAGRVRVAFGRRKHPRFDTYTIQNGLEIEAPVDAPVRAVHEGTVAFSDFFRGYGLMVVVDHGGKHHSLYAHLAENRVQAGDRVTAGQTIGTVGASGLDGPGVYFEMRFQGKPVDPADWLKPAASR
ncbi:MAG: peptidoglycan DD-metalloendopeptidase family protein [Vicinamibacteria bacterium]